MDAQRQLVKNVLLLALSYFHVLTQILTESLIHSLTAKISCSICGLKKFQLWLLEIDHKNRVIMSHVYTDWYICPCILQQPNILHNVNIPSYFKICFFSETVLVTSIIIQVVLLFKI